MTDPVQDKALAKTRFFIIGGTRLLGAILLVLGILTVNRTIDWPEIVGYTLMLIGFAGTFVIPQLLVRRWRTPLE